MAAFERASIDGPTGYQNRRVVAKVISAIAVPEPVRVAPRSRRAADCNVKPPWRATYRAAGYDAQAPTLRAARPRRTGAPRARPEPVRRARRSPRPRRSRAQ